ncbi:MAG: DUF6171 family protein [Lachnospiraceae bacterium]|nr:DUF6171 family protein [Lachnospiraceae bacterium]
MEIERDVTKLRACRKCFVYDEAEADAANIDKYLAVIKKEDLVSDEVFEKRILICRDCELRMGATCNACGCYVEFRANVKTGRCPKKKWK